MLSSVTAAGERPGAGRVLYALTQCMSGKPAHTFPHPAWLFSRRAQSFLSDPNAPWTKSPLVPKPVGSDQQYSIIGWSLEGRGSVNPDLRNLEPASEPGPRGTPHPNLPVEDQAKARELEPPPLRPALDPVGVMWSSRGPGSGRFEGE